VLDIIAIVCGAAGAAVVASAGFAKV